MEAGCPGGRVRLPFTEWPTALITSAYTGRSNTAALAMNKWAAIALYVSSLLPASQPGMVGSIFVSAAVDKKVTHLCIKRSLWIK